MDQYVCRSWYIILRVVENQYRSSEASWHSNAARVLKTAASTAHFTNCFIHTQLKHSHTGLMDEKALFNGYFATLIWIIACPLQQ